MLTLAPTLAELPFRGNRNYIHSTDLYPALAQYAHKQFSLSAFVECLTIRRPARHQVRVNLDTSAGAFATFCIRHGIEHSKGWLVETDEPVRSRIPFDEAKVEQAVISGPGFARLERLLPSYSTFELILILTKTVAHQENAGHWWICQIDFVGPLHETAPLESKLTRRVSNRYVFTEIYQAGQMIGALTGIADVSSVSAGRAQ